MKGFGKGLSPSKLNANRNLSTSGPVENNENGSSVDKLISQFENQENINDKHFMSRIPRKSILAEIHDFQSASDAQNHENRDPESDKSPPKKGVSDGVMLSPEQKDDVSLKAYDPLTNYLTPRPKYLRFDPNRRREILRRLENECREELNISPYSVESNDDEELSENMVENSSISPAKVCVVDPISGGTFEEANDNVVDGYEAVDEDEDEEEEVEVERGWCIKGVLKILALMIACFLSTSYICSLNSPTISPIQPTVWNLTDKNGSLEFVSMKMQDDGFAGVEVGSNYRRVEEVEVDEETYGKVDEILEEDEEDDDEETYGEISESFEAEILENLERFEREMIRNKDEYSKEMVDVASEFEFKADEYEPLIDSKANENELLNYAKTDENLERFGRKMIRNENEYSKEMVDVSAEFEFKADDYEPQIDGKTNANVDDGVILDEEVESSDTYSNEYEASETEIVSHGEFSDSMDEDAEIRKEKSEWNTETVVGISATLIVLTSLAIIHHSKKSRSPSFCKETEPVVKQNFAVTENVNPAIPSIKRKVEFLAREAPRELTHHIRAPTVELIGEIVVGKSTNRKKSTKNKISEDERSATLHQIHDSLPRPGSASSQPSTTELHSTSRNTSSGSFTSEIKLPMKEGSQSGEAMIGITPVRRSSRLRNRSAVISS